jgi:protein-disulfide isomerase
MMNRSHFVVIFTVLFSSVIIAGSIIFVGYKAVDYDQVKVAVIDGLDEFVNGTDEKAPDEIDMSEAEGDDAVVGDEDAKVTIVEFSDFQCPYCASFINDAYKSIKENYINTGKVKLVFRDFPLDFHAGAYPAALAAECVRDQEGDEAYFEMHDLLFGDQSILSANTIEEINKGLEGYAAKIDGVDMDEFKECVANDTFKDEINADISDGRSYGISGTPSFVIGGKVLVGAQPFSEFEKVIEAELAK